MHLVGVLGVTVFSFWTLVTLLVVLPAQLVALPFDPLRKVAAALGRITWGTCLFRGQPFWRLRITGRERCADGPFVVVANHQSFLDIPLLMQLPIPVRVVARPGVFKMPVYGQMARMGGHIELDADAPDGVERALEHCRRLLAAGISVVVFPEGTRSDDGTLGPFNRGAFQIALDAKVPVLPVCIRGTGDALPKGHPYGWKLLSKVHLQVLDPIPPEGSRRVYGQRTRAAIERALEGPTPWDLSAAAARRYRTRWRQGWAEGKSGMDPVFWALWERLPHTGLVLDVGCGEGLLAAYLSAAQSGLTVRGWDIDAQRVAAAQEAGLDCAVGDVRTVELPRADAVVCIDVLHYLSPAEQEAVVARLAAALSPGGKLVVRDPDVGRGAASWWTANAERALVAAGRHAGEGVQVQGGARIAELMAQHLDRVRIEDCSTWPFANVLISGVARG